MTTTTKAAPAPDVDALGLERVDTSTFDAAIAECRRLSTSPNEILPPLDVTDPSTFGKHLRARVLAELVADGVRKAASEAARALDGQRDDLLRAAAPGQVEQLVRIFAETVEQFTAADALAPDELTGRESEDVRAAYVQRADLALRLDWCVARRETLGTLLRERAVTMLGPWMVCTLPTDLEAYTARTEGAFIERLRDVLALVGAWPNVHVLAGPDRWRAIVQLGLPISLAGVGDVGRRGQQESDFRAGWRPWSSRADDLIRAGRTDALV